MLVTGSDLFRDFRLKLMFNGKRNWNILLAYFVTLTIINKWMKVDWLWMILWMELSNLCDLISGCYDQSLLYYLLRHSVGDFADNFLCAFLFRGSVSCLMPSVIDHIMFVPLQVSYTHIHWGVNLILYVFSPIWFFLMWWLKWDARDNLWDSSIVRQIALLFPIYPTFPYMTFGV